MKRIISFFESLSSTISMWASLLAIFAAITLTGLIEIYVKPEIQILGRTYIIQKEHLQKTLLEDGYPLVDSLITSIFGSKSTVIVDIPSEQATLLRSGGVISDIYQRANGTHFRYKELTNGSRVFRSTEAILNLDNELKGVSNSTEESGITMSSQDELQPNEKRVQVMPFFAEFITSNYNSNWLFLTTDSILKIGEEFRSIKTDQPLLLSPALVECRRVFSVLSIENNEAYDVKGLQLRIYKKYSYSQDDRLKLEAWTIGEVVLDCQQKTGKKISIQIPNLPAHSDLQLIVSSWFMQIKDEDLIITYKKLKSINSSFVWLIVVVTLLLSAVCRFTIGFLGRCTTNVK